MTRPQLSDETRARIDDIFARFHHEGKAGPGLAYGVVRDGLLVHGGGLGTAEAGVERPIGADTVFRIASMSKSFTAAAILILRDEGRLGLDEPIARFVPALVIAPGFPFDAPSLTIRHALTMSGGLPTDDPWADRQESLSHSAFDELLAAGVRFIDAPGLRFEYSNLGFALLGRVVEELSGVAFPEFVRQRVLEPLGLHATRYDFAEVEPTVLAIGHRSTPSGYEAVPFTSPGAFSAIGGVLSSVRDIGTWVHWLAQAQRAGGDRDDAILSRASRREMQQLHRSIPAARLREPAGAAAVSPGYGYGLFIEEDPRWGTLVQHSGGYPGFGSHMRWHGTSGWGVIAFGNSMYAPVSAPADEALRAILHARDSPAREIELWDDIAPARAAVEAVLAGADDAHESGLFSPNVVLDKPARERLAEIKAALAAVGPLLETAPESLSAPTSARLSWIAPAAHGGVRIELRLTPTTPALIHSYSVRALPQPSVALEPILAALRSALAGQPSQLASALMPLFGDESLPAIARLAAWRELLGPLALGAVDGGESADSVEILVEGGGCLCALAVRHDNARGGAQLQLLERASSADDHVALRESRPR